MKFPSTSKTGLFSYIDADFSTCSPGPKDMLDAWVAAATVREFVEGRGIEVGGGDHQVGFDAAIAAGYENMTLDIMLSTLIQSSGSQRQTLLKELL